jgi:endo-1,4-beta-xylanase
MPEPGRGRAHRVALAALLGAAALATPAAADARPAPANVRLEAESMRPANVGAEAVGDRTARRGRALRLGAGARATASVRTRTVGQLRLRLRRSGSCRPVVRVVVDGRRIASRGVRVRRYSRLDLLLPLGAGRHRVVVERGGRLAGCAVLVDQLTMLRPAIPLGTAVRVDAAQQRAYRRAFARDFDMLTPENELKMERIQPRRGLFTFQAADMLVDLARDNGKRVRGHTLVYGVQVPSWVTDPERPWTPSALRQVMLDHIGAVLRRYRGRIAEWDVVNEAMDPDGYKPTIWHRVLGPDYIEDAFRAAHAVDPHVKLFYNDGVYGEDDPRFHQVVALVRRLKQRGVPVDAVGLQQHTDVSDWPREDEVGRQIDRLSALGVQVAITEMDVDTSTAPHTPLAQRLAAQRGAYQAAARACRLRPACIGLTVWGVADRWSWRGEGGLPTLLDSSYRRKAPYRIVRRELARR